MPNDVVHEEIQQRQLTQSMPNDVVHEEIQQRQLTQSMLGVVENRSWKTVFGKPFFWKT